MIDRLKAFLGRLAAAAPGTPEDSGEEAVQLATAALLVEMTGADAAVDAAERGVMTVLLQQRFGLSAEEIESLVATAGAESRDAPGYHPFTSLINRHLAPMAKVEVVEMLWRIAYADGRLDDHEHHFVRKIADLLYVPHGEFIAAKLRARQTAALRPRTD